MNKAQEDRRFGITGDQRPAWQMGLEDMREVKRKAVRGGVSIEFVDREGRGATVDVMGTELERLEKYEMQKSAVPLKKDEPVQEKPKEPQPPKDGVAETVTEKPKPKRKRKK